jgi:hypothetical protein
VAYIHSLIEENYIQIKREALVVHLGQAFPQPVPLHNIPHLLLHHPLKIRLWLLEPG